MRAVAEPVACSSRAFLDAVGEAHGSAIMGLALDRLVKLGAAIQGAFDRR